MKKIFTVLAISFIFYASAQAQETTGHRTKQQQQQQQQQTSSNESYLRTVVKGEQAEALYLEYALTSPIISLSCSEPVRAVEKMIGHSEENICFDRGANFTRSSRYECYLVHLDHRVSLKKDHAFDLRHNECGGDGIVPEHF